MQTRGQNDGIQRTSRGSNTLMQSQTHDSNHLFKHICITRVSLPTIENIIICKVKCTLVQALTLCTGHRAHWGSRGIALPFHDQWHYKGVRSQRHALAALYPRERPSTHCTGGWVGPRASLDGCRKSLHHLHSIPGPSSA